MVIYKPQLFLLFSPLLFAARQCSWVKVAAGWGPTSTENRENYATNIVTGTAFLSEAGLETPINVILGLPALHVVGFLLWLLRQEANTLLPSHSHYHQLCCT